MATYDLLRRSTMGDVSAREQFIEENTGLIYMVVNRFKNRGTEAEDLFQIGCIGLIKAVQKFDLSFGVRFSTYAVPMIMGEIKRFLRDDGAVKVSRSIKEQASAIKTVRNLLIVQLGREPTVQEISESCGYTTPNSFYKAYKRCFGEAPLDLRKKG